MRFYYGFKPTNTEDVSKTLQERGIHFLRAAPSDVPYVSHYRVSQPGYVSYSAHLPAFMAATFNQKKTTIIDKGYPVSLPVSDCIPMTLPTVLIHVKKSGNISNIYRGEGIELYMEKKDGKSYYAPLNKETLSCINHDRVIPNAYGPQHTVRLSDVPACIMILRVISLFLKTHRYPAFKDEDFASDIEYLDTVKRSLPDDTDIDELGRGKVILMEIEGEQHPIHKKPSLLGGSEVVLRTAKPRTETTPVWGLPTEIPRTHGFHFPYVKELSKVDKETIPRVLSRFFMCCLAPTIEGSMKVLGDVTECWKGKIAGTPWGQEMSHLVRTIELAIPAQAAIFPVVDNGQYLGCFFSGGQVSISMKKDLFRPNSYEDCLSDIDCYMSKESVIKEVLELVNAPKTVEKNRKALERSIRSFSRVYLAAYVSPSDELKQKYARILLKYRQEPYFSPTYANFVTALEYISDTSKVIPHNWPIHPSVALSESRFERVLGVFGAYVPSPIIPGCRTVRLDEKVTEKTTGTLVLRLTTLQQAISDLRDVATKRTISNFAVNLSARFEHVVISGMERREGFLPELKKYADVLGPRIMTEADKDKDKVVALEDVARQAHVTDDLLEIIGDF